MSGRAMRIALMAQDEDRGYAVLVAGNAGLIETAPFWAKPVWENERLLWPNGAQAWIYSPERPEAIFGPEHHLGWASELHMWSRKNMVEAFTNFKFGLRLGEGKLVWDSNPRRKHPIIRQLLDRAEKYPDKHVVFRGASVENAENLTIGAVDEWLAEYGTTNRGAELLLGIQIDDDTSGTIKQPWIDDNRRHMPTAWRRRIISVDPAISTREGTDDTGIVELGISQDGQACVLSDHSGKLAWEQWGALVVDLYMAGRCDCVVIERNRGGDACVANVRSVCQQRGLVVQTVDLTARTHGHVPSVVVVKEVISRQAKEVRLEAVAPMYQSGKVSHVGVGLDNLEDQLTTYEPGPGVESPNALDACVHGLWELAGLWDGVKPAARHTASDAGALASKVRASKPSLGFRHLLGGGARARI